MTTPALRADITRAVKRLVAVWRNPDAENWRHIDAIPAVDAIEALCKAVDAYEKAKGQ